MPRILDVETRALNVANLQQIWKKLDTLNVWLDEPIAHVEEENRRSPLYQHRLEGAKKLLGSQSQTSL